MKKEGVLREWGRGWKTEEQNARVVLQGVASCIVREIHLVEGHMDSTTAEDMGARS